jgi:hypothetical protein
MSKRIDETRIQGEVFEPPAFGLGVERYVISGINPRDSSQPFGKNIGA